MFKKEFWKYFINTFKESKWLVIKYLIVGIELIIIGVIANKLMLSDLTYYNAIVGLSYFGTMIGFGIVEGFGIYINQNIKDAPLSKKYAKLGFWIVVLVSLFVVFMLAIFSKLVVTKIFSINFEIDYSFYYLMLIPFFLKALNSYLLDILKKTNNFKMQMINTLLESILMVSGLVLILSLGKLGLKLIAVISIITFALVFVSINISLVHNKIYSLNVFKPERFALKKKEIGVVISLALSEFIWEAGYFLLSMFILKSNQILYNQYCYLEDVLDIVNGIYFSFINVIAIKICRCIGYEEKENALNHSKNMLKGIFVIWAFYAIISVLLIPVLISGMNAELRSTATLTILLFTTLQLIRFYEWGISTYILNQSQYSAKYALIIESCATVYFAILNIIASFFAINIFLIWLSIILPSIIKVIIYSFLYIHKKWLNKTL